ncbi:hypothetical protein FraQA3DRAFT_1575 [Frankia sp. QA3]|nr:hypothetical protein FraQA3DRAFT_1575 [Frankia sp. QA3]
MRDQDPLRAARLADYGTVSTQLSLLSDRRLGQVVAAAAAPLGSGIGGRSAELDIEGTRVFVKRVPLADIELQAEYVRRTRPSSSRTTSRTTTATPRATCSITTCSAACAATWNAKPSCVTGMRMSPPPAIW